MNDDRCAARWCPTMSPCVLSPAHAGHLPHLSEDGNAWPSHRGGQPMNPWPERVDLDGPLDRTTQGDTVPENDPTTESIARARETLRSSNAQGNPAAGLRAQVDRCFTYHPPRTDAVGEFLEIREVAKAFGHRLITLVPAGRELASALTRLEEVVFHANAGIARAPAPPFDAERPPIRNPTIVDAEYVRRLQSVAAAAVAHAHTKDGDDSALAALGDAMALLRVYVVANGIAPVPGAEV